MVISKQHLKRPKIMKYQFILIVAFLLTSLAGCTLEDHEIPSGNVRIVKRERVGYGAYRYTHDAMNRLATEVFEPTVMISPYDVAFTGFTADNRLAQAVENFPAPLNDLGHEVQRAPDGKIERIRKYCVGGPTCTSGIWYFTYPLANVVEVKFWDNGSLFRGTNTYTFNSAGQITEIRQYNASDVLTTTTTHLTFDDKKNMLSFYPEGYLTLPASNNNVVDFTVTNHLTSDVTSASYAYEYNAEGWVTKRTRTGFAAEVLEYETY